MQRAFPRPGGPEGTTRSVGPRCEDGHGVPDPCLSVSIRVPFVFLLLSLPTLMQRNANWLNSYPRNRPLRGATRTESAEDPVALSGCLSFRLGTISGRPFASSEEETMISRKRPIGPA